MISSIIKTTLNYLLIISLNYKNSYRFSESFLNTQEALEMKSKCETIIHQSLQSMRFSRKRHRTTKSDVKNMSKALKQSKERQLAQENKSKYSGKIRKYEKKFISNEKGSNIIKRIIRKISKKSQKRGVYFC